MKKRAGLFAAIVGAICLTGAAAQSVRTDLAPTAKVETKTLTTPPVTAATPGTPALTDTDLNAWLDGFMPIAIAPAAKQSANPKADDESRTAKQER